MKSLPVKLGVILIGLLILGDAEVWGDSNDPEGYLGVKWETSAEKLERVSFAWGIPAEDIVVWSRKLEHIGEVVAGETYYWFKDDKFYRADSTFKEDRYYLILKDALISKYGQPSRIKPLVLKINPNAKAGEECEWILKKVLITLQFNNLKNEGRLTYIYTPIGGDRVEKLMKDIKKTRDAL